MFALKLHACTLASWNAAAQCLVMTFTRGTARPTYKSCQHHVRVLHSQRCCADSVCLEEHNSRLQPLEQPQEVVFAQAYRSLALCLCAMIRRCTLESHLLRVPTSAASGEVPIPTHHGMIMMPGGSKSWHAAARCRRSGNKCPLPHRGTSSSPSKLISEGRRWVVINFGQGSAPTRIRSRLLRDVS